MIQFLNEFCIKQLENRFSEYVSNGILLTDKKYWKICKRASNTAKTTETPVQALFMENMQKQSEKRMKRLILCIAF
ncbi:hypothetical protein O9992_00275 [Vibrio lentus]|nr:hypothetical protein [Vibrio lentus]